MSRITQLPFLLLIIALPRLSHAETVEYEIREVSRIGSRVITKGSRDYSLSEVKAYPYERANKHIVEKLLELEQGFKIGARIFNEKELTGFGLLAQQTDGDFSWEWFSKESGSRFKKLQGGQSVEVETVPFPLGEELAQVRFLEDTTLRFKQEGAANETHHIIVKAGSVLRFK
jgi:hypothetical protein